MPKLSNSPRNQALKEAKKERDLRLLRAEQARRSYAAFVSYVMPDYIHSHFSQTVCAELDMFLEQVMAGKRPVLLFSAPPQHGKSQLVSRMLPPYIFGRFPDSRIAACSYSMDLSQTMNRSVQQIMLDEPYARLFPQVSLNPNRIVTVDNEPRRNSEMFDIPGHKGYYVCTGVGGALTGKSVDIGIIDDPIKNEQEARSPTIKKTIENWYKTVFLTRLSKRSGQIVMATRWALDDLSGFIAKHNPKAKILHFPAIDSEGKALVPELHSLEKLLETKAMLTPAQWAALYQQQPVVDGGNIFLEHWFRRWNEANIPDHFDMMIASWDLTFKDANTSDYVVGQIWGTKGADFYLLDQLRDRLSFTGSKEAVRTMHEKYPQAHGKLIEDKANGPAIIDELKSEISGILPINPKGSKVARAYAVTPFFQAGNVYIPEDETKFPWVNDYVAEMISFPAGAHDDQVDATTQALNYLRKPSLNIWRILGDE